MGRNLFMAWIFVPSISYRMQSETRATAQNPKCQKNVFLLLKLYLVRRHDNWKKTKLIKRKSFESAECNASDLNTLHEMWSNDSERKNKNICTNEEKQLEIGRFQNRKNCFLFLFSVCCIQRSRFETAQEIGVANECVEWKFTKAHCTKN